MKRALHALLVVSLLLAGCAGVPGVGETNADGPDGPNADIGPATIDESVRESHRQRLRAAGSATYNATFTTPAWEQTLNATFTTEPNRSRTHVAGAGVNRTEFINDSGTYVRSVRNGETTYRYRTASPDTAAFTVAIIPFNATYERAGTGTVEGVPVARYTADSATSSVTLGGFEAGNLSAFNATLAVTDDGFVKQVSWRAETDSGTLSYNATYSALGETTVETPSWVGKAAANPMTPQVVFEYERDGDALTVQHAGGDALNAEAVRLRVENESGAHGVAWTSADGEITAGDARTIENVSAGATVRVVWTQDGRSVALDSYTV